MGSLYGHWDELSDGMLSPGVAQVKVLDRVTSTCIMPIKASWSVKKAELITPTLNSP